MSLTANTEVRPKRDVVTPSIHACALSRGGVSWAEMPRAPFKLKGEGSEEAGQRSLQWVLLEKKNKTDQSVVQRGEVAGPPLFPSLLFPSLSWSGDLSHYPTSVRNPRVSRH